MGKSARYPYHTWTDGQWHDAVTSDWEKTIPSLRATLHQYARAHGFTLMSVGLPNGVLHFKFMRSHSA